MKTFFHYHKNTQLYSLLENSSGVDLNQQVVEEFALVLLVAGLALEEVCDFTVFFVVFLPRRYSLLDSNEAACGHEGLCAHSCSTHQIQQGGNTDSICIHLSSIDVQDIQMRVSGLFLPCL